LQIQAGGGRRAKTDGLTPTEQLREIAKKAHELVEAQYCCWNQDLLPALAREGIYLWDASKLEGRHLEFVKRYWEEELKPILSPIVIDPAHPFPQVLNKALCIGVLLESKHRTVLGVVTVPRVLPRILRLPDTQNRGIHFVTLAGIIDFHLGDLFQGYSVKSSGSFRVTRNSELYVNEEEADNLLQEIAERLKNRLKGEAVRLETDSRAPDHLVQLLQRQFSLDDAQVYRVDGPVNLNRVMEIYNSTPRPN
jgi:polyphosphate kinase